MDQDKYENLRETGSTVPKPGKAKQDNKGLYHEPALIIETLRDYLIETHQEEIDNKHYGDKTCSYCDAIKEANAFLKGIK